MKVRSRNVLQEFEAHFRPAQPDSNIRGKSEWKQYGDGTFRFKLSVVNIPLGDDSQVDLWRDSSWLMRLSVQKNKIKVDLENDSSPGIPAINAGQILQIKSGDLVLAEGRYETE